MVPGITERLSDSNGNVRSAVVNALKTLGMQSESITAAIQDI